METRLSRRLKRLKQGEEVDGIEAQRKHDPHDRTSAPVHTPRNSYPKVWHDCSATLLPFSSVFLCVLSVVSCLLWPTTSHDDAQFERCPIHESCGFCNSLESKLQTKSTSLKLFISNTKCDAEHWSLIDIFFLLLLFLAALHCRWR